MQARFAGAQQAVILVNANAIAGAGDLPGNDFLQHREHLSQGLGVVAGLYIGAPGLDVPQCGIGGVVGERLASSGEQIGQHALIGEAGKGAQDAPRDIVAACGQRQPRQGNHGVAAPVAKPGIAGNHRFAIGQIRQGPGEQETVGSQQQLLNPRRQRQRGRLHGSRLPQQIHIPGLETLQGRIQIRHALGVQAAHHSAPGIGAQTEHRLTEAEMVIAMRQATLTLDGQVEILEPVDAIDDRTANRQQTQAARLGMHQTLRRIRRLQHRLESSHVGALVMIAAIDQQPHAQFQLTVHRTRRQSPRHIGGMRARLQPDALLQHHIADGIAPDRHPPFQPEGFQMHIAMGTDHATGPAIAEQRNLTPAIHQGGIGLGEHQPAPERRPHRRNQQAVIAPGQRAGHGSRRIAAQAIAQPPLAPFRLHQIAAQGPAAADKMG